MLISILPRWVSYQGESLGINVIYLPDVLKNVGEIFKGYPISLCPGI